MDAQPVDLLIAELRAKGPLVIQGEFGRTGYSQNPENLGESTAEQEVLGWKPGTRQPTEVRQAITVVGAVKEPKGAEYVYYVDPFDASDPVSGTRRPLYKISYRSLQENATPFCPGVFAYGARLSPNVQVTSPFTQPPTATTTTATTAAVPVMPRVFVKIKRATRSPN